MPTRTAVVAEARRWLGTPYRHQASLCGVGADCLGFVRGVWRAVIGPEPEAVAPYARDWAEARGREGLLAAAGRHLVPVTLGAERAGDIVLFRFRPQLPAKHLAIVVDEATFLHAYEGAGVVETAWTPWWARRTVAAFAFPGVTG